MFGWATILCAVTLALSGAGAAAAPVQVKVTGTYPAGDVVVLGRDQNFYLHLDYRSDQPVKIWARPYFEGKPAHAGSNPSRRYPAGSGEALGWFFLSSPGARVDEVRISAGDGSFGGTRVVAVYPVSVTGSAEVAQEAPAPAWIGTLEAADKAAQRADREKQMRTVPSAGDVALFSGFMLAMCLLGVLGFAAPLWGLWRWRRHWRWAAALPLLGMAFVVLRVLLDTVRDPTSHNLWPFEIVLWGAMSVGWMLVLALARRLTGAGRA
ncbi:hypothetical protein [Rhodanobacter spathiphylli]|uniref:Transmembrane protein n=1 Tax=Rhodanobacter spathiphylli B39 TaxID=1163407 RepID=I4VVP7_9GAMM|nr:hypothetical protein [Rhodanobacter spathiphylli]EIL91288.1 hypothetical protein UU7_13798 [Rhodanobacter spathiphylli B39]